VGVGSETTSEGYSVDNFIDRVALGVEWNAKDGNPDRDLETYQSLYDAGLIDGGVMINRTVDDLPRLGTRLGASVGMSLKETSKILAMRVRGLLESAGTKIHPRGGAGEH
jgi:Restriction endonuclease BglII